MLDHLNSGKFPNLTKLSILGTGDQVPQKRARVAEKSWEEKYPNCPYVTMATLITYSLEKQKLPF
jgi:hypothetical protein